MNLQKKTFKKSKVTYENYEEILTSKKYVSIGIIKDGLSNVILFIKYSDSFDNVKKFYKDIMDIISKYKVDFIIMDTPNCSGIMPIDKFLDEIPEQ